MNLINNTKISIKLIAAFATLVFIIACLAGVRRARELGSEVIVTDHHLPGSELPDADAIVNPNQPGDPFPSKHLAGVGTIFYVLLALRARLRAQDWFAARGLAEPNMAELLDLVARDLRLRQDLAAIQPGGSRSAGRRL